MNTSPAPIPNRDLSVVLDSLSFDSAGLVPAVVQNAATLAVLMLGYMNRAALDRTLSERKVCFWSRSRQRFWVKGETSGMILRVQSVRVNCENNSLLVLVDPIGPTCHTGHESCYYREAAETEWREIAPVITSPEQLYGADPDQNPSAGHQHATPDP